MWFYAALSAAFLSGLFTVLSKRTLDKTDPLVFFWSVVVISLPFLFGYYVFNDLPKLDSLFWLGIIGSVAFYTVSKLIFFKTLKEAVVSEVYPLISIGPVFTLILSYLVLAEQPTLTQIIGSGITIVGVYILNVGSARESFLEPFKILWKNHLAFWMLVSVLIASSVGIFDKIAITHTSPLDSTFALFMENLVITICLTPWVVRHKTSLSQILVNWKALLLVGIIGVVSNYFAMKAMGDGNPGLVTSVMRTQIFFVFIFSFLLFKDKPRREIIAGTIIMLLGLIAIKLGT